MLNNATTGLSNVYHQAVTPTPGPWHAIPGPQSTAVSRDAEISANEQAAAEGRRVTPQEIEAAKQRALGGTQQARAAGQKNWVQQGYQAGYQRDLEAWKRNTDYYKQHGAYPQEMITRSLGPHPTPAQVADYNY